MLTAGGRVVEIRQDPSAGNNMMVPTENELKTLLYEQVIDDDCIHRLGLRIDY